MPEPCDCPKCSFCYVHLQGNWIINIGMPGNETGGLCTDCLVKMFSVYRNTLDECPKICEVQNA